MTVSTAIETEFESYVFDDSALQSNYSPRLLKTQLDDTAETEVSSISYGQQVNFFQLLIERDELVEELNTRTLRFRIQIGYYIESDPTNLSPRTVRDGLEAVQDLIINNLYPNMQSIDILEWQPGSQIEKVSKGGTECWGGTLLMSALATP